MQFIPSLKINNKDNILFSDNTLKVGRNAVILFIHENEKIEKKIILNQNTMLRLFSIYKENADIKNLFVVSENCTLEIVDIFYGNVRVENAATLENCNCALNLTAKGVIEKNETADYTALASIGKNATNNDVSIKEHVYLLGKNSRINLLPGLEIVSNNINARHAATITQLDEEQLFYIMSRGFSEKRAKKEIISGFLAHELEIIADQFSNHKM
ncbi:MAG: SufD family Fe-S cluster assembly protein [Candidatus Micrarchaeota archaeon]